MYQPLQVFCGNNVKLINTYKSAHIQQPNIQILNLPPSKKNHDLKYRFSSWNLEGKGNQKSRSKQKKATSRKNKKTVTIG